MSSIVTISSVDNVLNANPFRVKIREELYLVNKLSQEIIEEIDKIREFTHPDSGILMKAFTEAKASSEALKATMPNSTPDSSLTTK